MECIKCRVSNNDAIIQCDGCNRYVHTECSELNASELKVMGLKGKRLLKFYCEDCTMGVRLVPELIKKVDDLHKEIIQLTTQSQGNRCSTFTEDEVIAEIQERNKRSRNVIMFNLPELGDDDLNSVREVVTAVTNENLNIEKIVRFGKKNKNGIRAIKVTFSRTEEADRVIRARKNNIKDKKIFIQIDMTQRQRECSEKLRAEIVMRREKGERDIMLKYIQGVPRIVKQPSKN